MGTVSSQLAVILLAASSVCVGQSIPDKTGVILPVIATDASGSFVSRLQANDFLLRVGRKDASPVALEEVEPFVLTHDGDKEKPVFLVFDKLTIQPPQLGDVANEVLRFLARSTESGISVTILVIDADGVRALHSLSTPRATLAAALEQLDKKTHVLGGNFKPSFDATVADAEKQRLADEVQSLERLGAPVRQISGFDAAAVQMRALYQIGNAGKPIRGRKAIVWLTNGSYVQFDLMNSAMTFRGQSFDATHWTVQYESAIEALNEGHTSVFPVGLTPASNSADSYSNGVTFRQIAAATGGEVLFMNSGLESVVSSALQRCGPYYLLTHELGPAPKAIQWTKLQVTTKRSGIRLQAPNGFFALPVSK